MRQREFLRVWNRINRYDPVFIHTPRNHFTRSILSNGSIYAPYPIRATRIHASTSYGAFGKWVCRSEVKVGTAVRSIKPGAMLRVEGHHLVDGLGQIFVIVSSQYIEGDNDV